MKKGLLKLLCFISFLIVLSCTKNSTSEINKGLIQVINAKAGNVSLDVNSTVINVPGDQPIQISFSSAVDTNTTKKAIIITEAGGSAVSCRYNYSNNYTTVSLTAKSLLKYSTDYVLTISSMLRGMKGETFPGVRYRFTTVPESMMINSATLNGVNLINSTLQDVNPKEIKILVTFSQALDPSNYKTFFTFTGPPLTLSISADNKTVQADNLSPAKGLTRYLFSISSALTSSGGSPFSGFSSAFYTRIDSTYQFPQITDDDLLTLVQKQTFKYFWDFGHPISGMARERNSSGDIVTTGGSGFGIMAMIVATERGFITRQDLIDRLIKILDFLETCDRFHGAWPHWLNGATGKTQPFSPTDNGGDLVETSYMMKGLLAMRQYLNPAITVENTQIQRINTLFNSIEFDWYTKGEKTLYWTWSPDYGYNLKITGYNETLITYIIAASSPSHSISADTYTIGYANNGAIKNGRSYYGYVLPLGPDYGGPLFFTHYSFLGLDPRSLKDQYADYWIQNVNQSLINWSYCQADPKKYPGYGPGIWGLTASDNPWGYSAQSPTNDLGVITPTAAVSSIVYTPVQSMNALKTYYYFLGDRLWGDYGFFDAFDVSEGWWASSTLAIDQGPIICMIENYRTGLLWKLFMSAPEVQAGLRKLGFTF